MWKQLLWGSPQIPVDMHTAWEMNRKNKKSMQSCRAMSSLRLHRCSGIACTVEKQQWIYKSSSKRTGKEEKLYLRQRSWINAWRFAWELVRCLHEQGSEEIPSNILSSCYSSLDFDMPFSTVKPNQKYIVWVTETYIRWTCGWQDTQALQCSDSARFSWHLSRFNTYTNNNWCNLHDRIEWIQQFCNQY